MMRIIDTHAHTCVPQMTREYGDEPWRPEIERVQGGQIVRNSRMASGLIPHEITDVNGILEDMAEMQIDTMAICPYPGLFLYDLPPEKGLHAAQIQNDAIAGMSHNYPERFVGLAVIPLQDINMALGELERAINDLGLYGIEIGTNVEGIHLGNPHFDPFWEAVADIDIFTFIHPNTFPSHLPPALGKYHLANLIGVPMETAITAADMVFSGLFERYPKLKVLLSHGGGAMPWLKGRWQHGYEVRPETREHLQQSPIESLSRFYVDTIVHNPQALNYLIETFGPDHVLLGSDFPFDMGPRSPVQEVKNLDISDEEKEKILGGNASRLMGLDYKSLV